VLRGKDSAWTGPPGGAVRGATLDDLDALLALESRFPGDRLSRRQFRHHLTSPNAALRVWDEGGVRACMLLLRHARRRAARLYSLIVDPAQRGRGLGQALLAEAESLAASWGCDAVRLEVREDNKAALSLYERRGYRTVDRRAGYYEDGCAALCLQRQV